MQTSNKGFIMGPAREHRDHQYTCHLLDGQTYRISRYPITIASSKHS